tara:strand:+ start:11 stop:427 length:417 start_codon:yes stop_codon:yes gene_type:complete
MTPKQFFQATQFAQDIINKTPRDQLEDDWHEFSDDIDINIYWIEDGPITAVAYPIRVDEYGFSRTDVTREHTYLPVTCRSTGKDVMTYRRVVSAPSVDEVTVRVTSKPDGTVVYHGQRLLCHNGMEPPTKLEAEDDQS